MTGPTTATASGGATTGAAGVTATRARITVARGARRSAILRSARALRISAGYYGPRYIIADPWRYRLPRAGYGQQWIRHYDDVILVDTRRGYVIQVIRNFYR